MPNAKRFVLHHPEHRLPRGVLCRSDIGRRSSPHRAQCGFIATYRSESPLEKTRSHGVRPRTGGSPVREIPEDRLGTGVRHEDISVKGSPAERPCPLRAVRNVATRCHSRRAERARFLWPHYLKLADSTDQRSDPHNQSKSPRHTPEHRSPGFDRPVAVDVVSGKQALLWRTVDRARRPRRLAVESVIALRSQ